MTDRPNILFVLSDQHSVRAFGDNDDNPMRTPTLDRLASEGMSFNNAYCQNPLCVPSRSSLLTGKYSKNTGVYDNKHILEANSPTLPRVLGAAGYRTCLIGKAHFNGDQFHGYQERPYGDFYGQAHQPDPGRTPGGGESGLSNWISTAGPSGIPISLTQTEICVAEATKWLQTHVGLSPEQPFFLSVNFDKPHFPINPPKRFFDHYAGVVELPKFPVDWLQAAVPFVQEVARVNDAAPFHDDERVQRKALASYFGCVEWVDDALGRVLDALDYLGLADNTIVVYSADHGEMGAQRGIWQKTVFYEDSARVPLIVRWPGHIAADIRSSVPVGLVDLLPTLCEVAETRVPSDLDGVSLLPLLAGDGAIERDAIFSESVVLNRPAYSGCMIRTGDWKYCYYIDGAQELYDLKADPNEWTNLADDEKHRSVTEELRARVVEFWRPKEQDARYAGTPAMRREKHFYEYSNQFTVGNGVVVDARP